MGHVANKIALYFGKFLLPKNDKNGNAEAENNDESKSKRGKGHYTQRTKNVAPLVREVERKEVASGKKVVWEKVGSVYSAASKNRVTIAFINCAIGIGG